jgi:hypothetical protein
MIRRRRSLGSWFRDLRDRTHLGPAPGVSTGRRMGSRC